MCVAKRQANDRHIYDTRPLFLYKKTTAGSSMAIYDAAGMGADDGQDRITINNSTTTRQHIIIIIDINININININIDIDIDINNSHGGSVISG
jgi:hypothetical protein